MKKNSRFLFHLTLFTLIFSSCAIKKMVVTPVNSERGDAVFSLIVPDNNYAKLEDINIYCWTQGGELNVNRVLIDFNLNKIPPSAIIDSASLNLYFNPTSAYNKVSGNKGNQGQEPFIIQRVTSDWNENEVTWNKQPETTTKNQLTVSIINDARADYKNMDVTKIIRDMVKNETGLYGIMLRHQNETPYNVLYFASSNHPNKKIHPRLTIYYRNK
jgi:hypothetical protein